jgi:hypothetical protein
MLEFSKNFPEVAKYLPEERDQHRLPRQWIVDILGSIVEKEFKAWVGAKIKDRNDALVKKGDLQVRIKASILAVLTDSSHLSGK